jgi:hypothetical protein
MLDSSLTGGKAVKRLIAIFLLIGMLEGCAASRPVTPLAQFDTSRIVPGTTTRQELIDKLGQPSTSGMGSDGTEWMTWTDESAASADPFSSHAVGGANLLVRFKKGVVTDYR